MIDSGAVVAVSELDGGTVAMAQHCGSLKHGEGKREARQRRVRASEEGGCLSESGERAPDLFLSSAHVHGDTANARSGKRRHAACGSWRGQL